MTMTELETEIMRDVFRFIRDHHRIPAAGDPNARKWWMQTAIDVGNLGARYRSHPLAVHMFTAAYKYLDDLSRSGEAENPLND